MAFEYGQEIDPTTGDITHAGSWGVKSSPRESIPKIIENLRIVYDGMNASIEAYSILRDDSGRIITITDNNSTYAITYDSSGRLNTIALTVGTLTNTVKALYNSYGQYQGLQKVGA